MAQSMPLRSCWSLSVTILVFFLRRISLRFNYYYNTLSSLTTALLWFLRGRKLTAETISWTLHENYVAELRFQCANQSRSTNSAMELGFVLELGRYHWCIGTSWYFCWRYCIAILIPCIDTWRYFCVISTNVRHTSDSFFLNRLRR